MDGFADVFRAILFRVPNAALDNTAFEKRDFVGDEELDRLNRAAFVVAAANLFSQCGWWSGSFI